MAAADLGIITMAVITSTITGGPCGINECQLGVLITLECVATDRMRTPHGRAHLNGSARRLIVADLCIYGAIACVAANAATKMGPSSGSTMFAIA